MNHPHEDLASYIDGTLTEQDRARVEAHLRSCTECAAETAAAETARVALRDLDELTPPDGMLARASRQVHGPPADAPTGAGGAEGMSATRSGKGWQRLTLAAAAVIVLVFVLGGLLRSTGGTSSSTVAGAPDSVPAEGATGPAVEGGLSLQALATSERDRYATDRGINVIIPHEESQDATAPDQADAWEDAPAAASASPVQPEAAAPTAAASPAPAAASGWFTEFALKEIPITREVQRCLRESGGFEAGGQLLRAYEGAAAGIPGYFGVFLQGSDPGEKGDRIAVWVAAKDDCRVIGFAQAYLAYPSPTSPPPGFDFPTT